ncbi:MAG: hypothetical protein OJF50_003569 [Nitrospira sp.]|nr:hypothetical protein [Nitrospira sp.]
MIVFSRLEYGLEALFPRMAHTQAWESMVITIRRDPFTPTFNC